MSWTAVARWAGRLAVATGVLVLLFVAYQLWGTSITTRLHQDALRHQFDRELARASSARPPAPSQVHATTAPIPSAFADGQPIGTIDIPEIGVDFVVVQGTTAADLELGPGHYVDTPLPGQPGNAAIAGHRTTYLHPFFHLDQLVPGDPIDITTTQGRFVYTVTSVQSVAPSDLAVLAPTAVPTLTLTTCNPPYSAAQRLVVQATLDTPPATPTDRAVHRQRVEDRHRRPPPGRSGWPAAGWGGAVVAGTAGAWRLARRRRWYTTAAIAAVGGLAVLALLFEFFQAVSAFLPASL